MDSWITFTQDDVLASVNSPVLTAAINVALGANQQSPIAVLIPDVIMQVRGYCRRRNTLGPDNTIPNELKNAAIDIVIYRCANRIAPKVAEEKKKSYDDAIKTLEAVSEGSLLISIPDCPSAQVTSAPAPAFPDHAHKHGFGRNEERGI